MKAKLVLEAIGDTFKPHGEEYIDKQTQLLKGKEDTIKAFLKEMAKIIKNDYKEFGGTFFTVEGDYTFEDDWKNDA